ncbi:protein kinase domain containing protein [Stylonychia lemnae]|uniref:non-specific serine/threonine protein kinase n=1 Tax=Stylonychia lemnae TaxID=5949 RepID=A0A077ZQ29_STYLE|nr:protein kinase domain containing protein [Stylonychia lemnae]|eukprot:CDW72008.1 protein kinase domain containing protein [Stylonychia lemnae]
MAKLSDKEKQNALNEVRILASIQHPNVIAYKEAFFDENSSTLCIVMEFADGGDLYQKIIDHQKRSSTFPEREIWQIIGQMTKGLKALHDKNILHRDLKCANVFLNRDGTVKMGDLNVSKVANKNGGLLLTQTGTPYYASPEVWKDQPYDYRSDIWSLGCVIYEMISLQPPFQAQNMDQLYKKVLSGQYPPISNSFSKELSEILAQLLQVIPQKRPSCDTILSHPKIVGLGINAHQDPVSQGDDNLDLLKTLHMPLNLNQLGKILPKSKYQKKTPVIKLEDINLSQRRQGSNDKRNNGYSQSQEVQLPQIREIESVQQDRRSRLAQNVPIAQLQARALSREASQESLVQMKTRRILQEQQKQRQGVNQIELSRQGIEQSRNQSLIEKYQSPQVDRRVQNSQNKNDRIALQDLNPVHMNNKLNTPQSMQSNQNQGSLLQRQMSHQRELITPNGNSNRQHHEQLAGMIRCNQNVMSAKELRNKYYAPIEQIRKDLSEMSMNYERQHHDSILHAIDGGRGRQNYSHIVNDSINQRQNLLGRGNYENQYERINSQQRQLLPNSYDNRHQVLPPNIMAQKRYSQNSNAQLQQLPSRNAIQQLVPHTPKQPGSANYDLNQGSRTKRIIINDENRNLRQIPSRADNYNQNISRNQSNQEDESQILKQMHKQAQMNMRNQQPVKTNYNRRGVRGNENYDPLAQYKPASQQQNMGLKLHIDNDSIQTERGYHGVPSNIGHRPIPISVNNGAITNRNVQSHNNALPVYNGLRYRRA